LGERPRNSSMSRPDLCPGWLRMQRHIGQIVNRVPTNCWVRPASEPQEEDSLPVFTTAILATCSGLSRP
jgi:hypothetical protein